MPDNEPPKYSYKLSLDQPYLIQQLTDNVALRKAVRLSLFAYFFLFFPLIYFTVGKMIPYFHVEVKLILTGVAAWQCALKVSDLRPDDKLLPIFVWDFIKYQLGYGMRKIAIYKGQIYHHENRRTAEEFMEDTIE